MFKVAQMVLGSGEINAAGTAKSYTYIFSMPGKWLIRSAKLVPSAAVTANGTNFVTATVSNVTTSTTITSRSYAATNSVADTPETLTAPTGLAAVLTSGDVVKIAMAHSGSGLATQTVVVLELEQAPLP
jgi:hypothetical protein